MKVFVIGANGQIGKQLVHLLHQGSDHKVRAMVRKEEQKQSFENDGIEAVLADLEGSVSDIAEAASGCDAFVFAAGSGAHTGADKTIIIDLDGAAKAVEAAKKIGAKRFVMVSAINADDRNKWTRIGHYMVAKHHADNILKDSGLTYTIVRPGKLLNEPGTGKIALDNDLERAEIPRADVAKVLYEVLNAENMYNQSFDLVSGEVDISEAVKSYHQQ